jgi:hypothetical protein
MCLNAVVNVAFIVRRHGCPAVSLVFATHQPSHSRLTGNTDAALFHHQITPGVRAPVGADDRFHSEEFQKIAAKELKLIARSSRGRSRDLLKIESGHTPVLLTRSRPLRRSYRIPAFPTNLPFSSTVLPDPVIDHV